MFRRPIAGRLAQLLGCETFGCLPHSFELSETIRRDWPDSMAGSQLVRAPISAPGARRPTIDCARRSRGRAQSNLWLQRQAPSVAEQNRAEARGDKRAFAVAPRSHRPPTVGGERAFQPLSSSPLPDNVHERPVVARHLLRPLRPPSGSFRPANLRAPFVGRYRSTWPVASASSLAWSPGVSFGAGQFVPLKHLIAIAHLHLHTRHSTAHRDGTLRFASH